MKLLLDKCNPSHQGILYPEFGAKLSKSRVHLGDPVYMNKSFSKLHLSSGDVWATKSKLVKVVH